MSVKSESGSCLWPEDHRECGSYFLQQLDASLAAVIRKINPHLLRVQMLYESLVKVHKFLKGPYF